MNQEKNKPMKSIRQEILIALNKHGEQTVDDLLDQINGDFSRKDIASNISQFSAEGLATRRKDGTTGQPAYKITDLGKSRIKLGTIGPALKDIQPTIKSEIPEPVVVKKPESKRVVVNDPPVNDVQKSSEHPAAAHAERFVIASGNDPVVLYSDRLDDAKRLAKLAALEKGGEVVVFAMIKVGSAKPVAEWVQT